MHITLSLRKDLLLEENVARTGRAFCRSGKNFSKQTGSSLKLMKPKVKRIQKLSAFLRLN